MKKILTMGVLASALVLSGCGAKEPISESEAMDIVLKDAGVTKSDATFKEQAYDKEDFEYSFTFSTSDTQYEYDVDGNGDILNQEKKTIKTNTTTNNPDVTSEATTDANGAALSDEQWEFLNIALTHHQVKIEEVSRIQVQKDIDDNVDVYDVDFYKDNKEYNCEIQIDNKQILSSDVDSE